MGFKFNPFIGNFDVVDSPNGVFEELEINGDITLDDGGTYTTTVQVVTPTANRTISFPDATGTVGLVAGSSGNLVANQSGAYAGVANSSVDNATGNITLGSRFISSLNGAASLPPVALTGTWFAGANNTSLPGLYIAPTGASVGTAWSTAGSGFGINAVSGFTGDFLHLLLNGTSEWRFSPTALTIAGGNDIVLSTTTGTKIGTGVTQLLGFYNKTPVVQPLGANQAALTNSTGGTGDGTLSAVTDTSTTDQSGTINDNFTELFNQLNAIRTALVDLGLIKGAA